MKQSHDVRIVFNGSFDELLCFLKKHDILFEFIPPGLSGSQGVLAIKHVTLEDHVAQHQKLLDHLEKQ